MRTAIENRLLKEAVFFMLRGSYSFTEPISKPLMK